MGKKAGTILFNNTLLKAGKRKKHLLSVIENVIDSGVFLEGNQNKQLIDNLQQFLGKGFVTLTASGHDALFLALQALNLKKDDEVIFPVNAYPTAFPIGLTSAKLIPVDVDKNGQISIAHIKEKISQKTKAIIIVHLYGFVGKMREIKSLIKNKNIILIEDCAQAFGTTYQTKHVGTIGDIGCFSFYPTKNLGTLGDGGAIFTKQKAYHTFFNQAKSYGEKKRYASNFIFGHSRMPELQAGVLNCYIKSITHETKERQDLFLYYKKKLQQKFLQPFVRVFESNDNSLPACHLFVIEALYRDKLKNYLEKVGIPTMIHYPAPIHLLPAFDFLQLKKGQFPMAEQLSKNILSLPFHTMLAKNQIDTIAKHLEKFYKKYD